MDACDFSACSADAMEKVKECVDYVCKNVGTHGADRENIDKIINLIPL